MKTMNTLKSLVATGVVAVSFLISPMLENKANAQESPGCFVTGSNGNSIDLSSLCGSQNKPVNTTPATRENRSSRNIDDSEAANITCSDFRYQESAQLYLMVNKSAVQLDSNSDGIACNYLRKLPERGTVTRSKKNQIEQLGEKKYVWEILDIMGFWVIPSHTSSKFFNALNGQLEWRDTDAKRDKIVARFRKGVATQIFADIPLRFSQSR